MAVLENANFEAPHDGSVEEHNMLIESACMDVKTLEAVEVTTFDPCIPPTIPIPISELGTHIADYHCNRNDKFQKQYQVKYFAKTIASYHSQPILVSVHW